MATTSTTTRPAATGNSFARIGNIILGVGLFISAFLWEHTQAQFTNSWLVGLAIAAVATIGLFAPKARYANVVLAAWLIISVWALPTVSETTFWHNLLLGIVSLVLALVPSARVVPRRTAPPRRAAHA